MLALYNGQLNWSNSRLKALMKNDQLLGPKNLADTNYKEFSRVEESGHNKPDIHLQYLPTGEGFGPFDSVETLEPSTPAKGAKLLYSIDIKDLNIISQL